ncbi:MAG: recombination mediator RecR [bacterium]
MYGAAIDELIDALRCLPGVGPKSAQRMALHLLERNPQGGQRLSVAIATAIEKVGHCRDCRTLTENDLCAICSDTKRNDQLLCVVESPADMFAIEATSGYRGRYFVLMGRLSPLDGIGPDDIGIGDLETILDKRDIIEVILATNLTVEGEATAYYISQIAKRREIKVSRIAQGAPAGSELEFLDGNTLGHALTDRKPL